MRKGRERTLVCEFGRFGFGRDRGLQPAWRIGFARVAVLPGSVVSQLGAMKRALQEAERAVRERLGRKN